MTVIKRVVIDEQYHTMLKQLATQNHRTLQGQLEYLIQETFKETHITLPPISLAADKNKKAK